MTLRNAGDALAAIVKLLRAPAPGSAVMPDTPLQPPPGSALDIDLSALPAVPEEGPDRSPDTPAWRTQPAVRFRR